MFAKSQEQEHQCAQCVDYDQRINCHGRYQVEGKQCEGNGRDEQKYSEHVPTHQAQGFAQRVQA